MSEWVLRALHVFNNLNEQDEGDPSEGIPDECWYCMDRYIKSEWRRFK